MHVRWHNAGAGDMPGHVQLQLTVDVNYAQLAVKVPNETNGDPGRTELYTDVLTRDDLNKLIRTLRRARDAAYGTDA